MKIEIGESLGCSYLRHVRQCWLVQANWKTSEHWPMREGVDVDEMFDAMRQKFDAGGTVFKKTKDVAQFLKQGEIDVVGLDLDGRLHAGVSLAWRCWNRSADPVHAARLVA